MKVNKSFIQNILQRKAVNRKKQHRQNHHFAYEDTNNDIDINNNSFLNIINNLVQSVDTSNVNGRRMFYKLCQRFIINVLHNNGSSTIATVQTFLDGIIELEKLFFDKSRILNYIVGFLIVHSDGDNLQSVIYVKLLDYFLTTYNLTL
ncbi:ac19 [Hemileuca sp. nucleopolyhedrovirus]|uniref:Ac19 n=1 Tax=Hemileuca sp. nucleopolyhedrovirus TaxID=1367203 RepID=S5MQD5_9ABAC|nr:ac19 [Hemileuca sp. nucleopolyhedrovirus]AGR56878.1 ac19 [Hemileuca sp. nucleopolyhedrovirus]